MNQTPLFNNQIDEAIKTFTASKALVDAFQIKIPKIDVTINMHQRIQDVFAQHQKEMQRIITNMTKFELPSMTIYPPSTYSPKVVIQEQRTIQEIKPSRKQPDKQRLEFGFYLVKGNSFEYKRKILKSFSLDTQPGKLLHMLLEAEGRYLSDKELFKEFKKESVRDFSFILRNLKRTMLKNGLKVSIERRKISKGYVLVDISELHTNQV